MVIDADTIPDPRAVMVHLHDASLAHRAVMGSWGLDLVALLAELEH